MLIMIHVHDVGLTTLLIYMNTVGPASSIVRLHVKNSLKVNEPNKVQMAEQFKTMSLNFASPSNETIVFSQADTEKRRGSQFA